MIWDTVIGGIFKTLDKLIPDPAARDEAKRRLLELEQQKELEFLKAEVQLATKQIEVNAIEAQSPSLFVSGWRPAVGWVCVLGLGYQFVGRPLLTWAVWTAGYDALPELELGDLMTLLLGMLGLGAYRTAEKFKGVAGK